MSNPAQILAGLGGAANIVELQACITRLRIQVTNPDLVDEAALCAAGAFGVVQVGKAVQVIVGPLADSIAAEVKALS